MDIKPIKNRKDHKAALARVEELWDQKGQAARDELEILAILIQQYEEKTIPVGPSDPIDMLKFCMEQQGRSQAELSKLLGSRSRATEILKRQRPLTLEMIRSLHAAWKIPYEVLIRETAAKPSRKVRKSAA